MPCCAREGAARRAVSAAATVARVAALLEELGRRAALLELLCSLCAGSDGDEVGGGGSGREEAEAGRARPSQSRGTNWLWRARCSLPAPAGALSSPSGGRRQRESRG